MARRKQPAISDELLDQLLAGADPKTAFAKDGLLDELKKAFAERALNAEIDHHLNNGEEDGRPNSRNGYGRKSVLTETAKIELEVPRDRLSTFDPQLIAKYQQRFPGFDEKIVSMYARGMSVREIQGHLRDLYGVDVSADLVSAVTDAVLEEIAEWQNRPLEPLYALVFFDAIRVKVRDEGMVRNKAVYVALGVRPDGNQGNSRPVDRADRGREILAARHERAEEPRRRRRPDRRRRWPEGLSGGDHRGVSTNPGPDLHRSPDPQFAGLRFLQRPQGCRGGAEADLPGQGRRRRARRTEHLRRRPMGPKIPGNRPVLATPLERGHPVLRLSRRSASDHLYDKRNRVIERQIAESGSRPRPFPHRRERAEASFSRVEPGPKRMENAAARVGHGESAIRDHIRGQVQVGVTKPAFTRKS